MSTTDEGIRTVEYLALVIAAYYQELIRLVVPSEDATTIAAVLQEIIFDNL